jgi:hypothetical protein
MPFKKPYRICNTSAADSWSLVPDASEPVCATLREVKDQYELRISIPGVHKRGFSVVIKQGILYVYDFADAEGIYRRLYGAFILPANIQWDKVKAYRRSYGLEIILPLTPEGGIEVHIPVVEEKENISF